VKHLRTLLVLSVVAVLGGRVVAQEYKSGIKWPEPTKIEPAAEPGGAPSDAIVLFDGTDLAAFEGGEKWKIENGYAEVSGGDVRTKESFGDCQFHIEWATPAEVKGSGQGRGNSGLFLMDRFEVQILDSFENETYFDGQAGSVYKQSPPMVNASRGPGEWQSYDILFTAPRFDVNGDLARPGYVTVLHNGVCVQNHFELQGPTSFTAPPAYEKQPEKAPIRLQNHGNPVRFRNIWIREIAPIEGDHPLEKPPVPAAKPRKPKAEPKPKEEPKEEGTKPE
jgi:hypothetical protein